MSRAVLSIGSNLGDRLAALQLAIDPVRPWLVAMSPVYESAPWGPVPQQDYLNAIIIVDDPAATADTWLARGQAAELAAGRRRELRWGPRTLDVDVIDVDGIESGELQLLLPHPRAAERAFVLVPWLAADPSARLAGAPLAELLCRLPEAHRAGVRLRLDLSLASGSPASGSPASGSPA